MNSPAPLRVVFMGSDPMALPLLGWLADTGALQAEVVGVFTQPDRPAGRGQKAQPNAIKLWAQSRGLPVHQPEKLTDQDLAALAALRPDVSFVMAYGQILREAFIAVPPLGTLNFHTSLLPAYRGASPIQTAVACGEKETAVTLMRIVRELDAGPVADAQRVPIDPLDTALEVEARLAQACVPLLARALPALAAGLLPFAPQNSIDATFCRKLKKADGNLDFSAPAAELAARVNGLFPWPSCSLPIEGTLVKLGLADATQSSAASGPVGVVLGVDAGGLLISTGRGTLRLRRLQRPGGRMLSAGEFLRGFPLAIGTSVPSQPMLPLVQAQPFRKKTN